MMAATPVAIREPAPPEQFTDSHRRHSLQGVQQKDQGGGTPYDPKGVRRQRFRCRTGGCRSLSIYVTR